MDGGGPQISWGEFVYSPGHQGWRFILWTSAGLSSSRYHPTPMAAARARGFDDRILGILQTFLDREHKV